MVDFVLHTSNLSTVSKYDSLAYRMHIEAQRISRYCRPRYGAEMREILTKSYEEEFAALRGK